MELHIRPHDNTSYQPINIPAIIDHYGGSFIGDFCIKYPNGNWSDEPVAIFYQPNPNFELGHSHYYGIFVHKKAIHICNAESAFSEPITAAIASDGEVIFSRYRHDHVTSYDGSVFIDGGRDYIRYGGKDVRLVEITIKDDALILNHDTITPDILKSLDISN